MTPRPGLPVIFALLVLAIAPSVQATEASETALSCRDFVPNEAAKARYPALEGACEAVVERNGELYGRFRAEVRRVTSKAVTLYLPATDHTVTVEPDARARAVLDGKKASFKDLVRGQAVSIYLSLSQFATPDIEEVAFVTDEDLIVTHPVFGALEGGDDTAYADKPARVTTSIVRSAAIIEAVDVEKRELRLIDVTGNRFSVIADPAAGDLSTLRPRDRIVTEYAESVAVLVVPEGAPELPEGASGSVAIEGLPEIAGVESVLLKAVVAALNRDERRATLVDENGMIHQIRVAADAPLDLVEVGDELRVRITRAVAISIERPES